MRKGVGRDGIKERKDGIVGEDNLQRQEKNLQRLVQDKWEGVLVWKDAFSWLKQKWLQPVNSFFIVQRLDRLLDSLIQQPNRASVFSRVSSIVPRSFVFNL